MKVFLVSSSSRPDTAVPQRRSVKPNCRGQFGSVGRPAVLAG